MTALDGAGRSPAPDRIDAEPARPPRWVVVSLRLFPAAWRSHYGPEFGALLEQTPASFRVLFDVLVAAVDAHVHPTGPRRRWPLMIERLRLSELAVFASWIVFVVAGLAFQRMTDGAPYTGIAETQPTVAWAYLAVIVGAVISLGAVTFAGLPIAVAIARRAIAARNWRHVALLAVPPAALAIWVGITVMLTSLGDPPADGGWRAFVDSARPLLGEAAFLMWVGVFVVAAIASTVAVSAAALDAEIDVALYRRAARPAFLTAGAMLAVAAAVAAWGVALAITSPATFWGSEGILGGSTVLTWIGVVVVMTSATAVAIRAALRARSTTSPTSPTTA